jgi:hypothetical protein
VTKDGVWIGFVDHLHTPLGNTSNYSAIANLHTLQITAAPLNLFLACCVFNSRSLATASNSADSSASRDHVVTVQWISRKWALTYQLTTSFHFTQLNFIPGWRPFHTNLLVFSSQADFQLNSLTHQPAASRHFAQPAWGARYVASGRTQRKIPPPTVPFCYERLPSDSPDIVFVFTGRYQTTHAPFR